MGEAIFLGLLAVVCIAFFVMTLSFPISIMDKSGGAAIFPQIVIAFLLVFITLRLVMVLKSKVKKPFVFLEMFKGMRLFFFASLAVYILLIKFVGYVPCTILFLGVTVNTFYHHSKGGWGSPKEIVIRNVLVIAFVFLLNAFFSGMLHVLLPTGTLWR